MDIEALELKEFTCRVCLENNEIGSNSLLNDVVSFEGENRELKELFQTVTRISIASDDAKPSQICENCTGKLLSAYEFILNVEKSEVILDQCGIEPIELERSITPDYILSTNEDQEVITISQAENDNLIAEEIVIEDTKGELEILDEFSYILKKDKVGLVNNTEGDTSPRPTGASKSSKPATRQITKPRYAIGSRLSSNTNKSHIVCETCDRRFAKPETYQRHVLTSHTQAPREQIVAKLTNKPHIECPYCPRNFMHKNDLQRHVIALHPESEYALQEENADEAEDQLKTSKKRKYNRGLCPHCGKNFPMSSLVIHIRRHLGINPYKCQQCEKAFPRKQDLTIHERQHSGVRPHVCTVCSKAFIRPNKLSRHMRIHLGLRPYKCEECGKSFSQSNDLNIHIRRHSGEKPYVCGICGDSFISGTALRVHRKAKEHFEPELGDPYANCRVKTRQ